jgi:hypothetical protein
MKPNADCQWKVLTGVLGILLACLLLGTVTQARGDAVPMAYTFFVTSTTSGVTTYMPDTATTAPFTASSSGAVSGTDGTNPYTGTGYSIVNANGSLGAESTISVSGSTPTFTLVGSLAIFTDELTVTAPGIPTGTPGTYGPAVTITGTLSSSNETNLVNYIIVDAAYGMAGTVAGAEAAVGTDSNQFINTGSDCSPQPANPSAASGTQESCTLSFPESSLLPITWGVPFEVATEFDAYVFATPGPGGVAEGGTSNFSGTAQITSIAVDANGNPVTDFSITSASGLDYTANGITPEPSSLSLFGVGLLFLAFVAKRRLPYNVS